MNKHHGLPILFCSLSAMLGTILLGANAQTTSLSDLRLVPEADYLRLELAFNPFDFTFVSELDENKDGEVSAAELQTHGQMMADRLAGALTLTAAGTALRPETAGMDPEFSGRQVRLRARYKLDARRLPLTLESDLNSFASTSLVAQVTYAHPGGPQTAQLDAQSRKVTFTPPRDTKLAKALPPAQQKKAALSLGLLFLLTVLALLIVGAGILLHARRRIG